MARIRVLSDAGELSIAETQLVAAYKAGEGCKLDDGERPEAGDETREIRAELLRYLILGGCGECVVSEGVALIGACVTGELNLSFQQAKGRITLKNCLFTEKPNMAELKCPQLSLQGSKLPGLFAQGITIKGGVFLSSGFHATNEVNLYHAKIGGQLGCGKGRFENPEGKSLNAQLIEVKGNVFLHTGFHATGEVSLYGAKIGGQLECTGGRFENPEGLALNAESIDVKSSVILSIVFHETGESSMFHATGEVSLSGAQIGGQLSCIGGRFENPKGNALIAQRMSVAEHFIWQNTSVDQGSVNLATANVGDLCDDLASWPDQNHLILDGFTYDRITAAPTDAPTRLEWLRRGSIWNGEFFPQPYVQLAKVLHEMGHERDAREVLIAKNILSRRHVRQRALLKPDGDKRTGISRLWATSRNLLRWLWDITQRFTIGYGLKPVRCLYFLSVLFLIATLLGHMTWNEGSFAPNSGPIIASDAWQKVALDGDIINPAKAWSKKGQPGQDWESFNRYAYAADVVIPIIDFGQTSAWAPSSERQPWGWHLWWARWVLSVLGWIITALAAAAVTGIIKRD